MIEAFDRRYTKSLSDPQLRDTLLDFQRKYRVTRDASLADVDFEELRQQLATVKNDAIARMPELLDQFTAACETTGATVFRAATAEDANTYIVDLARTRSVRTVLKSKSMVTEEIELNETLEAAGLHVIETDLGEWILQLEGDRPSHILAPAIHKNRRQIGDLLSRITGQEVSREDISEQVSVAKSMLRQEFFQGEMGISGANALIAETGTVMLVTNEGNAELTTTLPKTHVVVAGIEKLLPTLEDALLQLEILGLSATGQRASVYVTWITGKSTPDQDVHIVLLDNGREEMRASPLFRDALRCIRCGACSNVCPSYAVVGGHAFGYIYSGAIGLVNTPFHHGIENDSGPQSLCVSCNACQTVCPVDIPLPRQILDTRAWAARAEGSRWPVRIAIETWSRGNLLRLLARFGSVAQKPMRRGDFVAPPGLSSLSSWRSLPALADRPFRRAWNSDSPSLSVPGIGRPLAGIRVAYFVQCLTDLLYPDMGLAIVDVLRGLGATVLFPRSQHCCGLPAIDAGLPEHAKKMARHTVRTLESCEADWIVSGGTSCIIAFQHDYEHLFQGEPEWQERASAIAEKSRDFTSFLREFAHLPSGSLAGPMTEKATYHYFCQSYNVLGWRTEPLEFLSDVCGIDLVPLQEANVCCGFGGSVSLTRPEMCAHILKRKLENVDETGAGLLITDNPGCIMHLRGGINASRRQVKVMHTAEIVAGQVRSLCR